MRVLSQRRSLKRAVCTVFIIILAAGGLLLFSKKERQKLDRIILITIDTLRADHLGCYGYPKNTSPFIDMLSQKGILFQRAFAPISTTAPSHASIFTSLYPIQHNVLKNGHRLSSEFITLSELLSKMNYYTAGFVSTDRHFKCGNINQGFMFFDEPVCEGKLPLYRRANETINATIKWLSEHDKTSRFFLWIHLFDPHTPYDPPKPLSHIITKQLEKKGDSFAKFLLNIHHIPFSFYENNIEKMLQTINAYDGEVLFVDTEIRRL